MKSLKKELQHCRNFSDLLHLTSNSRELTVGLIEPGFGGSEMYAPAGYTFTLPRNMQKQLKIYQKCRQFM